MFSSLYKMTRTVQSHANNANVVRNEQKLDFTILKRANFDGALCFFDDENFKT